MTKVLVVEDEGDLRTLLVDTLADQGYDVLDAANGADALELASHEAPDMILLDLGLPDMDGFEVLSRLRENPDTQPLPVVILSAVPAELARIHRRTALGTALEEARGCSSESEIMVL